MLDNKSITIPGKKEYDFFRNNKLTDWNFSHFEQHQLENSRNKPNKIILVRQYKQCLATIVNTCKDKEVKQFVATLLQDVENNKVRKLF